MIRVPIADALTAHEMRRYPTEIGPLLYRGNASVVEARRRMTFSEVSAEIQKPHIEPNEKLKFRSTKPFALWEKEEISFGDFIDIINPLQHIPIVATLYRNWSGDQIAAVPRVIGGALWGRVGGLISGLVNAVVEWWSGKDIGDHIYAAIFGPSHAGTEVTAVAQSATPSSETPGLDIGGRAPLAIGKTPIATEGEIGSSQRQRLLDTSSLAVTARVASLYNKNNFAWNEAWNHHRTRSPV